MKLSDLIKDYCGISSNKSGMLFTHGKSIYLYNNVCCDSICRRVLLRSENIEILSERTDELLVYRSGAELAVYKDNKRLLRVDELVILYEIPCDDNSLYGVFAFKRNLRLMDSHFTDERILQLIDELIAGESQGDTESVEEFHSLEQAVRAGEVKLLNRVYVNGKAVEDMAGDNL